MIVATFIFTWDGSEAGYPSNRYVQDIATTAGGGAVTDRWSVGSRRGGMAAGDRVFLLRQGVDRGIVASGRLTDGVVFEAPHWADGTRTAHYVDVIWDRVLPVEDRLQIEQLLGAVPGHHWNAVLASGQQLQPPSDAQLAALWGAHIDSLDGSVPRSCPADLPRS